MIDKLELIAFSLMGIVLLACDPIERKDIYVSEKMFTTMVFNGTPLIVSDTVNAYKSLAIKIHQNSLLVSAARPEIKDYPVLVRVGQDEFKFEFKYSSKPKVSLIELSHQ